MKIAKRVLAVLMLLSVFAAFSLSAFASDDQSESVYSVHIYGNVEIVIYGKPSASEEQKILAVLRGESSEDELASENIICSILGHDFQTYDTSTTYHYFYPEFPYCKCENYKVSICSRCGYTESTLISTERVGCCP